MHFLCATRHHSKLFLINKNYFPVRSIHETRSRILILGAYGNFGSLLCERLAKSGEINKKTTVLIAGRSRSKAEQFVEKLKQQSNIVNSNIEFSPLEIDCSSPDFENELLKSEASILVHTCGPFRYRSDGKSYSVAQSCMNAGIHYIDLADSRDFVINFPKELHEKAKEQGLSFFSGASTVPAITSAVLDSMLENHFEKIETIDFNINPGNKTPRGLGTIKSVLMYCGSAFPVLIDGRFQKVYGWLGLQSQVIQGLTTPRLVSYCDIPDLSLFPERYPGVKTVVFRAGLELKILQLGSAAMALLRKYGIVADWTRYGDFLKNASDAFRIFGTDEGGMRIKMSGQEKHSNNSQLAEWHIFAGSGHGPNIPILPTLLLLQKLVNSPQDLPRGAFPSVGLFTLKEFLNLKATKDLDILTYFFNQKTPIFSRHLPEQCRATMPEPILRFHETGGVVKGVFQVKRKPGLITDIICKFGGLPPASEKVEVTVENQNNRWTRNFGGHKMVSEWVDNLNKHGLVMEQFAAGIFRVGFQLKPVYDHSRNVVGFSHDLKRFWVAGIPIPKWFGPNISGKTDGYHRDGRGWHVEVELSHPLLGFILSYEGDVVVQ